ncbi:Abi family protein [Kribbella sp.]|uniref:Abi family protein n=1 Tax=Kribbella sp. TaxID=1871183 RepID=UPI002D56F84B|nr:Abi family protein [Kribbella sp.]HZX06576.1 Abi family protein [Kribbella sp.]
MIDDDAEAERLLSVLGYYRLSGYWYVYRRRLDHHRREDRFVEGTTFRQVIRLYDADRRLKLRLLDALERVEIALRVMIGFTLRRRGAYAHLDAGNLDGRFTQSSAGQPSTHDRWLRKVLAAQTRSSEDFVQHLQSKYDGRLPVWVVTEILDFGSMCSTTSGTSAPTTLVCGTGTWSTRSHHATCDRSRLCTISRAARSRTPASTRRCASLRSCCLAPGRHRSGPGRFVTC